MTTDEQEQLRLRYWKELRELAIEQTPELSPDEPGVGPTLGFSLGRSDFRLIALYNFRRPGRVAVALDCLGKNAARNLGLIAKRQTQIERDLQMPLETVFHPENPVLRLRTDIPGRLTDETDWPRQHQWMLATLVKFKSVLPPIICEVIDGEKG